jgi:uncharacterized membrane protein required for colicin V production
MIDVVVATLLVLLVVRGWVRGLLREAIDVGTLVVGAILAFRLAPTAGEILDRFVGMSPGLARVVGGSLLFVAIWVSASVAAMLIHRSMKVVPGLSALNRFGGAALGIVYAVVLVVIGITLMSAAPLPTAIAGEFDRSGVVAYVSEPVGPAQEALGMISGDRALQSMAWIRAAVDDWVVDPAVTTVTLPVDDGGAGMHASADAAADVYERVNRARIAAGLEPLAWSDTLSVVATSRALAAYRSGSFVESRPIEDRLASSGIIFGRADERTLLAPTPPGLAAAVDAGGDFTDVGVGIVEGPYGLVGVVVMVA